MSHKFLCVIQARLGSSRLPGKSLMPVCGVPMVKRVFMAAKQALRNCDAKVVVAWPERYPDVDENDVLERFRRLVQEFNPRYVIRLTADCPLITPQDIARAVNRFLKIGVCYYNNHNDGHDVQVFGREMLWKPWVHKEHVFPDFSTMSTGLSVNTMEDLQRVRNLCKGK